MAGQVSKCFDDASGIFYKTLMSRGLGQIQRGVLKAFKANPGSLLDSITVTALVSDSAVVAEAQASSVRRALRKLAGAGYIVDMGRGFRHGRRHYALPETAERYAARHKTIFGVSPSRTRPL